jgi:hypothetical protein
MKNLIVTDCHNPPYNPARPGVALPWPQLRPPVLLDPRKKRHVELELRHDFINSGLGYKSPEQFGVEFVLNTVV